MEQRSHAESALAGARVRHAGRAGVVLGVVGGFTHAWYIGASFPAAAIGWVPVLFGPLLPRGQDYALQARRLGGGDRLAAGLDGVSR
ncbi:hypothetical protein [Nonomuraea dietziae]|uniref:hypothetical protein n=1 Tax=Nonomuraea dietziae TaxID=65515 RepID=UPI0031D0B9CF